MATFLVAMLLALQQRPLVTANLDRSEVRVGDPVTLRITVQATTGGVIVPMPSLPSQLQAVSTREVSHASLSLPGGRTTTVSRELILVANAPGEYAIPPIRIRVDGENAYTPRLTLSVTGAAAPSPTPGARLLARMEPDTVFVGQQATLVGELLMSVDLQMRLTRPPSYEAPSPSDFWMQELQSDARAEPRIIDEERYVGQRFYRAYFPLTAGKYAFAPAKATYEARQGFLFAPQVFELRSASPRIVVLPHPSAGRPSNFDGAVGKFDIAARVEPNQGAVGDALTLIVEITGSGNVKALPVPRLPAIAGAEVLDPSETTEVTTSAQTVSGSKRFSWVVVPERAGALIVPAIEYVVFDPRARVYATLTTNPLTVDVQPAGTTVPQQRRAAMRTEPMDDGLGFASSRGFLALQAVPVLFLAAAVAWRRRKQSLPRTVRREWRGRLAALNRNPKPFARSEQLLRDALSTVARLPQFRSGSAPEVFRAAEPLLGTTLSRRVEALLERLEAARYAAVAAGPDERASMLVELGAILDELWVAADSLAGSTRASAFPFVLLLALQQPDATDMIRWAVNEFDAGRQAAAADTLRRYVATRPHDASGWYNLGVVYRAQRHPALAAWSFLKAAELDPRAADIDAQIDRSGVRRLGLRVRTVTHLTRNETFALASAFWWIGALALTFAIVRRGKGFVLAAMLMMTLACTVLLAWAIERALPRPAIVLDAGAPLLAASNRHADEIRQLVPLTGVTVLEESDGWVRVRTLDGERGWVEETRLGRF